MVLKMNEEPVIYPTESSNPNFRKPFLNKRRLIYGAIILLLLVGLGFGLWQLLIKNTQPYKYSYVANASTTLSGAQTGAGASFQRPKEFVSVGKVNKQAQNFAHDVKYQGHIVSIAGLSFSSVPLEKPLASITVEAINEAWKKQDGEIYSSISQTLKDFVKNNAAPRYNTSLTNSQPFTNPNISKNAWQLDINLIDSDPADGQNQKMTGNIIYAIGQKAIYYYALAAVDYNWQANTSTWQQMLDSLKLEQ